MFDETPEMPFAELPAALVDEVLERTPDVGQTILDSLNKIDSKRADWRAQLASSNLLRHESNLEYVPIPTACGIDGSYAVERMLATDLIAAAAVAVEGLTPPSEKRHWPDPHHQVVIEVETHNADTSTIVRALMIGMELSLAVNAPHEGVFLDGSLTTPIIYFNQALNKANETRHLKITSHLLEQISTFLAHYQTVLASARSDRCWIAVPKYTTRREIGKKLEWPESHDDRGLLSSIVPDDLSDHCYDDPFSCANYEYAAFSSHHCWVVCYCCDCAWPIGPAMIGSQRLAQPQFVVTAG